MVLARVPKAGEQARRATRRLQSGGRGPRARASRPPLFEHVLAPSKPITGKVLAKGTGRPAAPG